MYLANYLGVLHQSERDLADAFRKVGEGYAAEADVFHTCNTLAKQCEVHAKKLGPFVDRYGEERDEEPERLYYELFDEIRGGSLGLLRDLHDLYVMANFCDIAWTMVGQAAQGIADRELLGVVSACEGETSTQIKWLKTRMKQAAPQTLLVASS
ncbi:MAG TPA: hypothetical protein VHH10_04625 [Rubrobacteraceae bacterium]|nr:hypothetical protein [Rubrobacteraceae bacterium]